MRPCTRIMSAVASLAACTGGDGPDGAMPIERSDSAGVEIVWSPAEDHALDWTRTPSFMLGGEDSGPESFYRVSPRLVDADGRGRLYVLNTQAHEVSVFDSTGEFLRAFGSTGSGPGELQRPGSIEVSPAGTVSVFDYGKGALVRYTSEGARLDPVPFEHRPPPSQQPHMAAGESATIVATMDITRGANAPTHVLRRFTPTDTTTLAAVSFPSAVMAMYPACGGGLNLPPIFAPDVVWDAREDLAAVSTVPDYVIDVFENGALVRSVRRRVSAPEATADVAAAELGEGFTINFGRGPCRIPPREMVEKRGFAPRVPLILRIAVSPAGEIWVLRRDLADLGRRLVDVFGADGGYLGTLEDDTVFPVAFIGAAKIATIATDSLDIDRLVVHEIGR